MQSARQRTSTLKSSHCVSCHGDLAAVSVALLCQLGVVEVHASGEIPRGAHRCLCSSRGFQILHIMNLSVRLARSNRKTACAPRAFKLRKARSTSDFEAVASLCAAAFATTGDIFDVGQPKTEPDIAQIVRTRLGAILPGPWDREPTDDLLNRLTELNRRKEEAAVSSCDSCTICYVRVLDNLKFAPA